MNHLVPRTCTEVSQTDAERGVDKVSGQPLSQFRAASAYVLLGDPGSGKTTAFEVECDELGPEAERITARDFLWLDLDSHPEWRGRTLFIDGLDEVRAGSPDARTPFDQIRGRLDRLGRPPFRISCREADWLGSNDLKHLEAVSEDSQVKTLRLDPLRESDVGHILESRGYMDDVQGFIAEAKGMGLEGLLFNPQSLELLASAVVRQGDWPESRLETFERACAQMATEHNEEHIHGEQQLKPDRLIDVAGHLCAVQLISGAAGYSLNRREDNADYPGLDSCVYESPDILRRSLATKLFTVEADSRFAPVHRHIAEFLGARHVSRLIQDGLPAGRVVSLITGADGMVVTGLRGFSAWLASQCREARESLIERDPIGVGLYGDIRGFSVEEKDKLIGSLNREVAALGLSRDARSAFGPLANSDMESTLHDFLTDSRRAVDQQMVVEFLLHLLRWGEPLPNLLQRCCRSYATTPGGHGSKRPRSTPSSTIVRTHGREQESSESFWQTSRLVRSPIQRTNSSGSY